MPASAQASRERLHMQDHSDAARAVGPAIRWPSIDREAIGRIARATGWTMLLAAVAAVGTLAFLYVANRTEHTWRHAVRVVMLDLFGEARRHRHRLLQAAGERLAAHRRGIVEGRRTIWYHFD